MERDLLQRLMSQAFLYDDPHAYRAGVQAAWGALRLVEESAAAGRDVTPARSELAPHEPARATG